MEGSLTDANAQPSSGSISQSAPPVTQPLSGSVSPSVPQVKDEPLSQVKCDPTKEMKTESSSSTREVKAEQEESESKGENAASVKQEERTPEPDSEDSFTPERVVEVVQRLLDAQESRAGEREQPDEEREAIPPHVDPRKRVSVSETSREQGYHTHREGQEEREEDMTRQIHSCLTLTSFQSMMQMLMKREMTQWEICEADSCVWNTTLRH